MGGDRTIATTGGEHSVSTAAASTEVAPETPAGAAREPRPEPKLIGRYRIVKRLGEGGMGVVWEAIDPELGRGVAVKVMRESRAGSVRLAERMRREAQALARLSHPNVVSVFDVGLDAGELYIVMQLIAGQTLDEAVRDKSLPEILALFVGAGRGLAAAHKAGIVHRDFKPTNVLVDSDGVAKVTDFGLARRSDDSSEGAATESGEGGDASLTRGDLVGTPAYMAPEQFLRGPVTPATDQFAFCLALWEAVTGERAYPGRDAKSIEKAVLADQRRPVPSQVPQRLRAVLTRGLARDPAARFASMTELVEQLEPRRRRVWLVAGLGALLLAAVAVVIAAAKPAADSCRAVDRGAELVWNPAARADVTRVLGAQAPGVLAALDERTAFWRATRVEACRTNQAHTDEAVLAERYRCLDRSLADEREAVRVLSSALDPKTIALGREIADAGTAPQRCTLEAAMHVGTVKPRAPVPAALYDEIARAHAALSAGRGQEVVAVDTSLTPRVLATGDDAVIAEYLVVVGEAYAAEADLAHARTTLRTAAEAAIRSGQDELAARSWAELAQYSAQVGDLKAADDQMLIARAAVARLRDNPRMALRIDLAAGHIEIERAEHAKGAEICERGLAAATKLADTTLIADARHCLFDSYLNNNEPAKALEVAHAMYDDALRTDGPDHPTTIEAMRSLASAQAATGDTAGAKPLFDRAFEAIARADGSDSLEMMDALHDFALSDTPAAATSTPAALDAIQRAVVIAEKRLPANNPQRGAMFEMLAGAQSGLQNHDAAIAAYDKAIAVYEQLDDPAALARCLYNEADELKGANHCDRAMPLYARATKVAEETGRLGQIAGASEYGRGACLGAAHQWDEAQAALEHSITQLDALHAPLFAAQSRWELADELITRGQRAKGIALAKEAVAQLAGQPPPAAALAGQISAWIAKH